VICLRAEDKLRMETREEEGRNGRTYTKTTITPERWAPVCEKRLPYELITSLVLSPDAPGVPIALKLQAQHRMFVPLERPLDERVGEHLAAWARGASPAGVTPAPVTKNDAKIVRKIDTNDDASALVPWGETALDPDAPQRLPLFPGADEAELKAAGKALRECIARASTYGLAVTWWELNEQALRGRSSALANWIAQALPPAPTDHGGAPGETGADTGQRPTSTMGAQAGGAPSPSSLDIEPCASRRALTFGAFWRMSASLALRHKRLI
jgi:hypothetical protein